MALTSTILFQAPQHEIASSIADRIGQSASTSIVTGFVTPGGLAAIDASLRRKPYCLNTFVVGAATYPAFEALDDLVAAGVSSDRLYVHLGHTQLTGGTKNPFARYHPMLHSKIYYMELPGSRAAAFVGSHNLTGFALGGLNGEASILLEGELDLPEFQAIRSHIAEARSQAVVYSPGLKEAYAWWSREFLDGLKAELQIPHDWTSIRTILVFAAAQKNDRPKRGDHIYFEIPAGIEQIETLKTEVHLFLFEALPSDPQEALAHAVAADAQFKCQVLGAENRQGNRELNANWRIDGSSLPCLCAVPSGVYRPSPAPNMQQVRANVLDIGLDRFEYLFERERAGWDPELSSDNTSLSQEAFQLAKFGEGVSAERFSKDWQLVKGLNARSGPAKEVDQAALKLAAPDSGAFTLVSLRRRRTNRPRKADNR